MMKSITLMALSCAGLMTLAGPAQADGLADLKAALVRASAPSSVKALVETSNWTANGEGKDLKETRGQASVGVEDGDRGMQVLYSNDLLTRLETEERANASDPKNKTLTRDALRELDSTQLHRMIDSVSGLQHAMDRAQYKNEQNDSYDGSPARLLTFALGIDKLSEDDRKYVKKFDGTLSIWISADGTPLASRLHWEMSGRALVFISFASSSDESETYTMAGNRLVTTKKETSETSSGAGEKRQSKVITTLLVQS